MSLSFLTLLMPIVHSVYFVSLGIWNSTVTLNLILDSAKYPLVAYANTTYTQISQLQCCRMCSLVKIPLSVSLRKRNHLWDLSRQWLHHYSLWRNFTQERIIDLGLCGFSCLAVLFKALYIAHINPSWWLPWLCPIRVITIH